MLEEKQVLPKYVESIVEVENELKRRKNEWLNVSNQMIFSPLRTFVLFLL